MRKSLYPSIGWLYPEGTELLSKADEDSKLVSVLSTFSMYRGIAEHLGQHEQGGVDDEFFKIESKLLELAFESQVSYVNHIIQVYTYTIHHIPYTTSDALRRILRLREAEGAGDSQPGVDR
ncbi:hypothetical protein EON64_06420 [archaeon]|nr:MAG: hypothetical protein EON64_06420 [archaeon]